MCRVGVSARPTDRTDRPGRAVCVCVCRHAVCRCCCCCSSPTTYLPSNQPAAAWPAHPPPHPFHSPLQPTNVLRCPPPPPPTPRLLPSHYHHSHTHTHTRLLATTCFLLPHTPLPDDTHARPAQQLTSPRSVTLGTPTNQNNITPRPPHLFHLRHTTPRLGCHCSLHTHAPVTSLTILHAHTVSLLTSTHTLNTHSFHLRYIRHVTSLNFTYTSACPYRLQNKEFHSLFPHSQNHHHHHFTLQFIK